jgi:gamma-glutamyl-gamma-aminobutyrate hydrolase PuuD
MKRPTVVVVTRRTPRKGKYIDYVAEAHLELLVRLKLHPVMVPVVDGTEACLPDYAAGMSGLLIVEGEDVEPKHYEAVPANHRYLEQTHPVKDEIEIKLMRMALRRQVPILGICRGSQLLNVVCGGTLFGDVQKEKKSWLGHIDYDRYDIYRHPVAIVPGTPLHEWYGRESVPVTSYHHQGVRDLAKRFRPMAHAEDGLVEAYYDPKAEFVVGLQFHPERMPEEPEGNFRIWKAFRTAVARQFKK